MRKFTRRVENKVGDCMSCKIITFTRNFFALPKEKPILPALLVTQLKIFKRYNVLDEELHFQIMEIHVDYPQCTLYVITFYVVFNRFLDSPGNPDFEVGIIPIKDFCSQTCLSEWHCIKHTKIWVGSLLGSQTCQQKCFY